MKKDEERPEVFRGHLEECVRHLAERLADVFPPGAKNVSTARKPMADFCDVCDATVREWLVGKQTAVGPQLVKLWCFLDLIGYRVIEFERLTRVRRGVAQVIGFGLLSTAKVAELIGYANDQELYRIFFEENRGMTAEHDEKMLGVYKAYKAALEQAYIDKHVEFPPAAKAAPVIPLSPVAAPVVAASPLQEGAIDLMQALLRILEGGAFADLSNGSSTKLQESKLTIVRLTAHLSRLSAHCLEVQ